MNHVNDSRRHDPEEHASGRTAADDRAEIARGKTASRIADLEEQVTKLAEVNAALNARLAEKDMRIADLEETNRQLMELRRQIARRVSKAVKERYGIVHEDALNSGTVRLDEF